MASHEKWILWPGHPKHSQNHYGLAEGQPDEPLSKKIWPPSSKLTQKCHLSTQGQWILWPSHPKHSLNHPGLAEGQPEGPLVKRESGLPAQKIVIH